MLKVLSIQIRNPLHPLPLIHITSVCHYIIKMRPNSPSLSFMLSHPAHLLSLGFGSGLIKFMPGTCGSILGWIMFFYVTKTTTTTKSILIFIGITGFILGTIATNFTSRKLGSPDPNNITLDEIVAMWLALSVTMPDTIIKQALCFLLFRYFDISKPQPIKYIDIHIKHGIGIMADDIIASIYAWITFEIIMNLKYFLTLTYN